VIKIVSSRSVHVLNETYRKILWSYWQRSSKFSYKIQKHCLKSILFKMIFNFYTLLNLKTRITLTSLRFILIYCRVNTETKAIVYLLNICCKTNTGLTVADFSILIPSRRNTWFVEFHKYCRQISFVSITPMHHAIKSGSLNVCNVVASLRRKFISYGLNLRTMFLVCFM